MLISVTAKTAANLDRVRFGMFVIRTRECSSHAIAPATQGHAVVAWRCIEREQRPRATCSTLAQVVGADPRRERIARDAETARRLALVPVTCIEGGLDARAL